MREMKCGFCGKPFIAIRDTAEYCSAKCRVYSHRGVKKPCVTASVTADAEPCVTASVTPPDFELTPEMLASAKRAREAREKMGTLLDEQWLSLREFNRSGMEYIEGATAYIATLEAEIEELKAENVSLRECWDEAEAEIADLKAEVP